jgi:hypothetical protein
LLTRSSSLASIPAINPRAHDAINAVQLETATSFMPWFRQRPAGSENLLGQSVPFDQASQFAEFAGAIKAVMQKSMM